MFEGILRVGERLFPERQILIRSRGEITHITLSSGVQAAFAAAALLGIVGWSGGALLAPGGDGSGDLRGVVETLRAELAEARGRAGAAERQRAPEAAELALRVKELESELATTNTESMRNRLLYESVKAELAQADSDQKRLKVEREKLSAERGKLQNRLGELEQARQEAEKQKAKAEKSIAAERESLKLKMGELEQKLSRNGAAGTVPPAAAADSRDAGSNGFDLDKFLGQFGLGVKQPGVGGPFVALGATKPDDPAQREKVDKLLHTLPLTAPLDHFQLESRFGVRTDPFNGRQSMHTGLDLSAPYRTPVYNTSPGTVVFAGYSAGYGKMVEIDHGMGIHTKYGHLNRITVNLGQHLTRKTQIGLLGSTGRSTGPHVHYEVLVNGVPQDPEKFLLAGKSIGFVKASQ